MDKTKTVVYMSAYFHFLVSCHNKCDSVDDKYIVPRALLLYFVVWWLVE